MKWILLAVTSSFSASALALMCPGNFNEINIGDSLETVQAACGKATSEKTSESDANSPQEWNYFVPANSAFYQNVSQNTQATLKTTVAFSNGKVTNMNVNGVGLSNTAICAGNPIQIGDTQETVEKACGKPQFINRGTGSQADSRYGNVKPQKITTLSYDVNGITTTLTFTDGVLTKRE